MAIDLRSHFSPAVPPMSSQPVNSGFAADWVKVQEAVGVFVASAGLGFHDAEDVVQRVATKAFEKYTDYDSTRATFLAWVIGIARNEVMHWRRSVGRDRHSFTPEVVEQLAAAQIETADRLTGVGPAVAKCMEEVEGRARQVLEQRYLNDRKPAQIAKQLNTTSASIRVTLNRARNVLQRCVERRLGGSGGAS